MKSLLSALALVLSLAVSSPIWARASVPIENLPNNPAVAASGKVLTLDEVKRTIQMAAMLKNWSLEDKGPGAMVATLNVRGKHTIVVDVSYTASSYSFTYNNSVNMNYTQDGGQGIIHPNYNKWVQDLRKAIQIELLKL